MQQQDLAETSQSFSSNPESIIEISGFAKTYSFKHETIQALKAVSFQVHQGEILGLLGPNGAGKTTLVKLMMGFLHPSAGQMRFQGHILQAATPRRPFGYLPEQFAPNPSLSAGEYLNFQCRLAGLSRKYRAGQVKALLQQVGMESFALRKISKLSKGMGQRVGLAQAFVGNPSVLILDEPTSGLDPLGKNEVIRLLLDLQAAGKTIFFCSHILSEVERLCDRIGILAEGELCFLGTVSDFLHKWQAKDLEEAFQQEVQCRES